MKHSAKFHLMAQKGSAQKGAFGKRNSVQELAHLSRVKLENAPKKALAAETQDKK